MSEVAKQWWPSTLYEGGGDNEPDNGLGSLSFVWESVAEGETPSLTIPVTCSDGLQYSTNGGKTWNDVVRGGAITAGIGDAGKRRINVRRRPSLEPVTRLYTSSSNDFESIPNQWILTGNGVTVSGNIMSLLGQGTELGDHAFSGIFANCTALTGVSGLVLPAMTLSVRGYWQMFYGCTNITNVPALPATALAELCYGYMFAHNSNITTFPNLPAQTMVTDCYHGMFFGCNALTGGGTISAKTLTTRCWRNMFRGCVALPSLSVISVTKISGEDTLDNWLRDAGTAVGSTCTLYVRVTMAREWKEFGDIPSNWQINAVGVPPGE